MISEFQMVGGKVAKTDNAGKGIELMLTNIADRVKALVQDATDLAVVKKNGIDLANELIAATPSLVRSVVDHANATQKNKMW